MWAALYADKSSMKDIYLENNVSVNSETNNWP